MNAAARGRQPDHHRGARHHRRRARRLRAHRQHASAARQTECEQPHPDARSEASSTASAGRVGRVVPVIRHGANVKGTLYPRRKGILRMASSSARGALRQPRWALSTTDAATVRAALVPTRRTGRSGGDGRIRDLTGEDQRRRAGRPGLSDVRRAGWHRVPARRTVGRRARRYPSSGERRHGTLRGRTRGSLPGRSASPPATWPGRRRARRRPDGDARCARGAAEGVGPRGRRVQLRADRHRRRRAPRRHGRGGGGVACPPHHRHDREKTPSPSPSPP